MKRTLLCFALCVLTLASCQKEDAPKGRYTVTFGQFVIETTATSATLSTTRPIAMLEEYPIEVNDLDLYLTYKEVGGSDETWVTEFAAEGDNLTFNLTELKPETSYSAMLWFNAGGRGMKNSEATTFTTLAAEQPEPQPDAVELPYLSGLYFGNQYGATVEDYNYSVVLATTPNCFDTITGDVLIVDNSQYLFLDIYAGTPAEEYNIRFTIPEGTYSIDLKDSAVAGTVGYKYSSLYTTNDTTGTEVFFVSGTVTVSDNTILAVLLGDDGVEYRFSCPTASVDNSQNFGPTFAPGEQSTLEGDLEVAFSQGVIFSDNYGDYYVVGKNNWYLYVKDEATGDTFTLELLAPMTDPMPIGRFPVTRDLNEAQMVLPGYVNAGEIMWSWYCFYDQNGIVTVSAPIDTGEVTITDNGDETVSVTIDVVDDMGNKITGTCTAVNMAL